jgi:hypothetical protein
VKNKYAPPPRRGLKDRGHQTYIIVSIEFKIGVCEVVLLRNSWKEIAVKVY